MRICGRSMQEGTSGRSHQSQSTTSRQDSDESRICLQHHDYRIPVWRHRGQMMLNSCVMHPHTGPAPGIMVWGGIGYHSRTPLERIAGTLNNQRYIPEVLEPVVLPYL
ncbi:transposable element Tcb1 transposase [Trichonephila clavipes]|nr:transposable element Tcb1 transposase [Trichonephila clavipes]